MKKENVAEQRPVTRETAEELKRLLGELTFDSTRADARSGGQLSVYAHPRPTADGVDFDALVNLCGRSEPKYDLAGLRLMLTRMHESSPIRSKEVGSAGERAVYYLADGATNRRGQLWFRNLPSATYHASLPPDELRKLLVRSREIPGSGPGDAAVLGECEVPDSCASRAFILPDRRIAAALSQDVTAPAEGIPAHALLTLQTTAGDLENAAVRYSLGDEGGTLTLSAREQLPGMFSAAVRLEQPLRQALACVPVFLVTALGSS
ncbi:hypothetical protein ACFL59_09945 [Planctomycetota bacterium]